MGRWGHDRDDDNDNDWRPSASTAADAAKKKKQGTIRPKRKAAAETRSDTRRQTAAKLDDPRNAAEIKNEIKRAILANTNITLDDLCQKLGKGSGQVSRLTVSNIRAEFRHSLKLLRDQGLIDITI